MSDRDASCSQNESRSSSQEPSPPSRKGKKCPYCSKHFAKADHYTRHIRSHTKEKPFRCGVCLKAYPRHDTLLRHSRTHQAGKNTARRHTSQASNSKHYESKPRGADSAPAPTRSVEFGEATVGNYREVLLAATSNGRQSSSVSQETATSIAPQPYDFQTAISSHEPGHQPGLNAGDFSEIVSPPQNINMSLLPVPGGYVDTGNGTHIDPGSFVQSFGGIDSTNWFLEDDFDVSIFDKLNPFQTPDLQGVFTIDADEQSMAPERPPPVIKRSMPHVLDLRHHWYTQVPLMASGFAAGSGAMTPHDPGEDLGENIDEIYRAKLASKLRPPLRDEPLPTIEFMNLCIHLFFTRFNIALPIVHGPTFRPTTDDALLVLSICSAGTLCLGSDASARSGCMLFERVNKAHLSAPWERHLSRKPGAVRAALKASMIGQTFALLSEHPFHLTTASSYHGTLISIARHARILSHAPEFTLAHNLSPQELHQAWIKWAQGEEMKRIALLLHIHDAELAALFHHEPIFRHSAASLPVISSVELFNAPSAAAWAAIFREEGQNGTLNATFQPDSTNAKTPETRKRCPMLLRYAALSGIGASIAECRHLKHLTFDMITKFESELISWHYNFPDSPRAEHTATTAIETPFSLMPLWHYSFMTLVTDLNVLELAIGREGPDVSPSVRQYVSSWIASPDSKRCLLHALLLQNFMVNTSMGSVTAIHTPRVLFAAAVCWACYMLYQPSTASVTSPSTNLVVDATEPDVFESLELLPEIRAMDNSARSSILPSGSTGMQARAALKSILTANTAEMKAATLCVLETMLRRLGTSGISRRFADIIQILIAGDGKDDWTD